MKLLVISSAFPPFAAPETAQTVFFCERFAERGLDVHVLTRRGNQSTRPIAGVTVHPVMPDWGWRGLPQLATVLRTSQADAILLIYIDWIYGCHPMITFAPVLARWLGGRGRFYTLLENENELSHMVRRTGRWSSLARRLAGVLAGPRGLHRSYGALLRDSDGVMTFSQQHSEAFERAQPGVRKKVEIIPVPMLLQVRTEEAMDSNRLRGRRMLGISENEMVVIYFGYIYPLKGLETLISAFAQLSVNARLLIVGGFDEGPYILGLRDLSREVGAADRIHWLGYCEDEAASLYLQAADLSVLPFNVGVRMSNSSFAVVAAHGLPIITTRGETLESPFVDGENVSLCAPRDPIALVAAMSALIVDPQARAHLAGGARRLAQEMFSPAHVTDSILRRLAGTP